MNVGSQTIDSLVGSIGGKLWYRGQYGGAPVSAWIQLTANRELLDTDRSVVTALISASLLTYAVPIAGMDDAFAKVATGLSIALSEEFSLQANAAATLAARDNTDFSFTLGLRGKF